MKIYYRILIVVGVILSGLALLPFVTFRTQARGWRGYVAAYGPGGYYAPPSSVPANLISQTGGAIQAVAVDGRRAYVGAGPRLEIMDISDPANITLIGKPRQKHMMRMMKGLKLLAVPAMIPGLSVILAQMMVLLLASMLFK